MVELCEIAPIKQVAGFLGVGWDLVKEIFKSHLKRRLKRRKLSTLRYIAVDEFATRKGHRYMTVVMDLESGAIVHAQEGKDATALAGFLDRLKRSRAPLQAVAMDMSEAYLKAVREVLGSGTLFGAALFPDGFQPWVMMILPSGGFFTLAGWLLLFNWLQQRRERKVAA